MMYFPFLSILFVFLQQIHQLLLLCLSELPGFIKYDFPVFIHKDNRKIFIGPWKFPGST